MGLMYFYVGISFMLLPHNTRSLNIISGLPNFSPSGDDIRRGYDAYFSQSSVILFLVLSYATVSSVMSLVVSIAEGRVILGGGEDLRLHETSFGIEDFCFVDLMYSCKQLRLCLYLSYLYVTVIIYGSFRFPANEEIRHATDTIITDFKQSY